MARTIPRARHSPLDPPPDLLSLMDDQPLSRLAYPDGHVGWLVTSHAFARMVLGDTRFSSKAELLRSALHPDRVAEVRVGDPAPPGFFAIMDPPEHTIYRRVLAGSFTLRKMNELKPRIIEVVDSVLGKIISQGPPSELVSSFAVPIPSMVVCELLGVPEQDREEFAANGGLLNSLEASMAEISDAMESMSEYLMRLLRAKRADPAGDLLSDLALLTELDEKQAAGVAILILVAGHDTTASMLALGTLALLESPEQVRKLLDAPAIADNGVEELLRYLSIVQFGLPRTAVEDVELGGSMIRAGETVTVSLPAANRDESRFEEPGRLDVTRKVTGHLGFGYGVHQCLGQHLARIELREAYVRLFQRIPSLRLAVRADDLIFRDDHLIYGVHSLPVDWD